MHRLYNAAITISKKCQMSFFKVDVTFDKRKEEVKKTKKAKIVQQKL